VLYRSIWAHIKALCLKKLVMVFDWPKCDKNTIFKVLQCSEKECIIYWKRVAMGLHTVQKWNQHTILIQEKLV
jgi:hypothetical protein